MLDGDLDTTACQAIERHCRDCAPCARLVERLRETIGLCREAGNTPLPEPVRQRAKASIERLLASEKRSRPDAHASCHVSPKRASLL
jgi:anti-sigma factor RsiW